MLRAAVSSLLSPLLSPTPLGGAEAGVNATGKCYRSNLYFGNQSGLAWIRRLGQYHQTHQPWAQSPSYNLHRSKLIDK